MKLCLIRLRTRFYLTTGCEMHSHLLHNILCITNYILLIMALSGCTQPQAKPERSQGPRYRVEQRMSPAMKAVVMELVYMADPNVFKAKEIDPFAY